MFSTGRADASPSRSPNTGPVFRIQRIGNNLPVAHRLCSPGGSSIKEAAHISASQRTKAGNFQSKPIIQIPADGPSGNHHAHQLPTAFTADREFMPLDTSMVPMMFFNKFI